ncbi:MAG: aldo/keto reductase [Pseudomonadales bacterium]|nr:aldo/keto reductase [Pseudomonadales bacterium]MDP6472377.1 aldo/keto reductase [Pseudomonadales bacterium]MDP6828173.1 aldo/keto reductase [Pseudomonadales bacterium]MDP6970251.1 aldo/keto reductase [Pseudomonadales bacterium]
MNSVQLGRNCGLRVSELCLGTMNFGEPGRGHQGDWTLGLDDARPIFKAAIDHGLYYFDCADIYGVGASEEVVGVLLNELLPREQYVLGTKISMPMGPGANQGGLSRKHIMEGVDACLTRLGHDYIDHLIIHRHPHGVSGQVEVPIEESLEALHDVVKAGKALYLGASSMFAWQFVELQMTAEREGFTPFVSMQNHYNLIYREEEREMNPYCSRNGVALTPWSPLARGILTGAYKGDFDAGTTDRSKGGDRMRTQSLYRGEADFDIAARVAEVAERIGKTPAQVSLAWLMNKPEITSPIVGVSRIEQLDQLVEAASIRLDEEDVVYLEELYAPVENLLSIGSS